MVGEMVDAHLALAGDEHAMTCGAKTITCLASRDLADVTPVAVGVDGERDAATEDG